METNINTKGVLREKAVVLMAAAYDFWREHQKLSGPSAVVWLTDDDGRMVVFTRAEYREVLMENIEPGGTPMVL